MRDPKNIQDILTTGPDMLGLIFFEGSPRCMYDRSDSVLGLSWGTTRRVGVFVNSEGNRISELIKDYSLHFVQLHGRESPSFCQEMRNLGVGVIKAFSVGADFDFSGLVPYQSHCDFFLFDTNSATHHGGTGKKFNWSLLYDYQGPTPFFLSGGIGLEDISLIESFEHPLLKGVDLNSKLEIAPGLKNKILVNQMINCLRNDQI